jgi:hypothetical protein
MYLQKVISKKLREKFFFLVGVLKVNEESSRIWIRIMIGTKMLQICNTVELVHSPSQFSVADP